ncbi:MAG: RNA polymerase sigma factor [Blastochloris sp.]|nr:RNA polymerase sigma factor [Blastochloris sp.]
MGGSTGDTHPGQGEALEELRALLRAFLTRALVNHPRADPFFIDDMAQESLLKILNKKSTFNGRSRFTTWAYTLATRTAFSELRRRDWGHISLETLQLDHEIHSEVSSDTGAQFAQRDELHQQMLGLIQNRLTSAQRTVLLAELNGMPQDEIARQTGRTRNATYKIFHDARRALKKALEEKGVTACTVTEIYKD